MIASPTPTLQTVTFALLLARSEGSSTLDEDLHQPVQKLAADHALLSRALQVLTDPAVRDEIAPPLRLLQRVIDRVPADALIGRGEADPWLYFYEDFLSAYDPDLRKDAGAYYTPTEVVRAQVRLIDRLLVDKLQRHMGFAEQTVITLDPAVGTGTYLLGVIDHAMRRVELALGRGAVPGYASDLGRNVYGFEIMVGPYAVAQLRVSRSLMDHGATLPKDGPGVYLTDTLESPHAQPPQTPLFYQPLAEQHRRALRVKDREPVIVCLGNPPYDRHPAADAASAASRARSGSWVRWGDPGGGDAIFRDFLQPALDAGHGGDVKNVYNLYVYFWRWALWKTFEHTSASGPGIVSYISAASYLDGDAFVGMREHMRRLCDEIWIIDLGGEGRGTRRTDNVFAIQTPVAIAVAACYGKPKTDTPATVHYARIEGTRDEKLAKLDATLDFGDLIWELCPGEWHAPFRPAGKGNYFDWPLVIDLMPWQQSGAQVKRTWPIAPDDDTLKRRWRALLKADDRGKVFKQTRDRKVGATYPPLLSHQRREKAIAALSESAPASEIVRYAYRSFDRQWLLADNRIGDFMRPVLWSVQSERQVYATTLLNHPLGTGPAMTVAGEVPDLHHFRGSYGAREVIPLYRDAGGREPNIPSGLLRLLSQTYKQTIEPEDFLAYAYGVLAQPSFTQRFRKELETRELRLPLTKDAKLFAEVAAIGRRLLWLHTYAQRLSGSGRPKGKMPVGLAKCTHAVSDKPDAYPDEHHYDPATRRLTVGPAGVFEPVEAAVFEFDVSGMKVVDSWLGYRMKSGRGKTSSPLDDIRPLRWTAQFTTELLELLWVLEETVATYPKQKELLDRVLTSTLFRRDELPAVPAELRRAPAASEPGLFQLDDQADE
jgi:Type ISP C-terminal specificity domain/N-6 DNA Methylase